MAKDNRMRMPSSEGGIVRYFDNEAASNIMLKPIHVIYMTVAIAVVAIALRVL